MRRKREYDFVVTVKHPDYFFYNIISSLLCLMTVTAEIFGLLNSAFTTIAWIKIVLIAFVIIYLLVSFLYFNKKKYVLSFRWPLFASAVLWFFFTAEQCLPGFVLSCCGSCGRTVEISAGNRFCRGGGGIQ